MVSRAPARGGPSVRRVVLVAGSTCTALVLLLSYHTSTGGGAAGAPVDAVAPVGVVPAPALSPAHRTGTPATTAAPRARATTTPAPVVVNGTAERNPYGVVQVQVTLTGRRVTHVTALSYPTDGQSGDINSSAVPELERAALAAQSAGIDTVSGATYTSVGFRTSLQSALDAAHR